MLISSSSLNPVLVNLLQLSLRLSAPWWWELKLSSSTLKTSIKNSVMPLVDHMFVSLSTPMFALIHLIYQKWLILKMPLTRSVLILSPSMVFSALCSVAPNLALVAKPLPHFLLTKKPISTKLSSTPMLVPASLQTLSHINPPHQPLLIFTTHSPTWVAPVLNSPSVFVNMLLVHLQVFSLSNPISTLITKWLSLISVILKMNFAQSQCILSWTISGTSFVPNKNAVFLLLMRPGSLWNMMTPLTSSSPSPNVLENITSVSPLSLRTLKTSWATKWVVPSSWTRPCSYF